jgi:predicted O-methyltransferase YrrM
MMNTLNGDAVHSVLGEGLSAFYGSPDFAAAKEALAQRTDVRSITSPQEVLAMLWLIQALKPQLCLEIGTYFAGTTRLLAEALAQANPEGKITTIDPYGGQRVPAILDTWPTKLRALVDFRPLSSMDYFGVLATLRAKAELAVEPSFVFVDGNHDFEFALFDILRSADHVRAGGVIVVDNMEQHGPHEAVRTFLEWNPAWSLWLDGCVRPRSALDTMGENWAVLLSPAGVGISKIPCKFSSEIPAYRPIKGIRVNTRAAKGAGRLGVWLNYFSVAYDHHVTGQGISQVRTCASKPLGGMAGPVDIFFEAPAGYDPPSPPYNTRYELEVGVQSEHSGEYVVLDAKEPYQFIY